MKRFAQLLILLAGVCLVPSAIAKKQEHAHPLSPKIMQARSVLIVCECPRGLAVAESKASQELQQWGRFQLVHKRNDADLVLLFSGNPYLGDYLTRDGPDTRPVSVDITIMTAVDPKTGENLWSDSRRWGSWRVAHATEELVGEFREQIEAHTKRWTLNDILMCSVTPELTSFANLTAEDALAKSDSGVSRIEGSPDRLLLNSMATPEFCKQAQLILGRNNRIFAFDVIASRADTFDVNEVLQHADQFDFGSGKDLKNGLVYFSAQSKDKKILIRFDAQGRKSALAWVRYTY